jgi:hypothetical protein
VERGTGSRRCAIHNALAIAAFGGELPDKEMRALVAIALGATADTMTNDLVYLAIAAGAKDEALLGAARMVSLAPTNADLLDTLAETYHALGRRADALRVERTLGCSGPASGSPPAAACLPTWNSNAPASRPCGSGWTTPTKARWSHRA